MAEFYSLAQSEDSSDVFLSHDWGKDEQGRNNHDRVSAVNDALKQLGYKTWFDSDKMTGDIVDTLCDGIDKTRIFLVFVTQRYAKEVQSGQDNNTQKLVFKYAMRQIGARNMIPVIMEERMKNPGDWKGPLGLALGGTVALSMFFDFEDFERFTSGMAGLKRELNARLSKMSAEVPQVSISSLTFPMQADSQGLNKSSESAVAKSVCVHPSHVKSPSIEEKKAAPTNQIVVQVGQQFSYKCRLTISTIPKTARTRIKYNEKGVEAAVKKCTTLENVTNAVSKAQLTSVFEVTELLLRVFHVNPPNTDDIGAFINILAPICRAQRIQKVSHQYLDMIISLVEQSLLNQKVQLLQLLKLVRENEQLSTLRDNVIISRDKRVDVIPDREHKHYFTFKHPCNIGCKISESRCGFILGSRKQDNEWIYELCVDEREYKNTGLHYHDYVQAQDMCMYAVCSGMSADDKVVSAPHIWWYWWEKWLPDCKNWRFVDRYVVLDITGKRPSLTLVPYDD